MPEPCVRMPTNSWHGQTVYNRYYTIEQAKLIVSWINKFELYQKKIDFPEEAREFIFSAWEETVENFNNYIKGDEDGTKVNCEESDEEESDTEEGTS
jgi:hypothetical protein